MTSLTDAPVAPASTLRRRVTRRPVGGQSADDFLMRERAQEDRRVSIVVIGPNGTAMVDRPRWIVQAEEELNLLRQLPPRWDGHRASQVTRDAVESAVQVLARVMSDVLAPPQFFPLPNGGLQMEWHAGGDDIEIEVDPSGAAFVLATNATGEVLLEGDLDSTGSDLYTVLVSTLGELSERVATARRQ
jgi:hypothetical protein